MPAPDSPPEPAATALATFMVCTQLMMDPATPEARRREAEQRMLEQLPIVRALGVFELFDARDPALSALLRDELRALTCRETGQERQRRTG